jgi:hypothetical protein
VTGSCGFFVESNQLNANQSIYELINISIYRSIYPYHSIECHHNRSSSSHSVVVEIGERVVGLEDRQRKRSMKE